MNQNAWNLLPGAARFQRALSIPGLLAITLSFAASGKSAPYSPGSREINLIPPGAARVQRAFSIPGLLAITLSFAPSVNSALYTRASTHRQANTQQEPAASKANPIDDDAVRRVEPVYPPIAKSARLEGAVIVLVTIDNEGNVLSAEALSGHPLLRDAAITAARQWKFKPAGIRVQGTITFNFMMGMPQKTSDQEPAQNQDPRSAYVDTMRDAVKANPDSPEAHFRLGMALETQNKTDEAIAAYKQALQLKPDYPDAFKRLYQAYLRARRYDDAVAVVTARIALKPDDASLYQQLGQAYFNEHKFEQAVDADKQALEIKPPYDLSYQVYREMGAALVNLGQFGEAMDAFKKSLQLKPDDSNTLRSLGWAYQTQGSFRDAVDTFQKVLKLSPTDSYSILSLAAIYARTGQIAEAETQYRDAIRIAPRSPQGYVGLAGLLSSQQKAEEAEATLRQGLTMTPGAIAVHVSLSNVLYQQGKTADAVAQAREALRLDPRNPTALNNLGYYLAERNENLDEALKLTQRAVDSAPNVPGFRDSLGWVYFKLGRLEEAEQYIAGIAKQANSPVIDEHLGDVYAKRGKQDLAVAQWQKALTELQKAPAQSIDSAQLARLKSKISAAGH
jgi:TonB family protein